MTMSTMPPPCSTSSCQSSRLLPESSIRHFGRSAVSGSRREPLPALRITALSIGMGRRPYLIVERRSARLGAFRGKRGLSRATGDRMGEWTAILLAGERPGENGFAQSRGVAAKALIPVAGEAMLARVARALLAAPS